MSMHPFSKAGWLVPAAILAIAPGLPAQPPQEESYMGENPDRYASVRVLEGEATIRKGDVDETLGPGVPVTEGDVVESRGRGVLQLADGTRVAFDAATRFQLASLFAREDRDPQVLLRMDYGRLQVALGRDSEAQVRVDTPSGTATLGDGATAGLEMERDGTVRLKVFSGRVTFVNERDRASLLAGERLTAFGDQDRLDRIRNFNTYGGDAFDAWAGSRLEVRYGPSWDKVPPELRYYSDSLDRNGEWIWVDEYRTWCWRPLGVAPEWRPYWQGRWAAYPGGMTWVSAEPWGYVTYHHGRWGWGAGLGWYWIPGVYYAPAWVAWQTSDAYFGWAPLGFTNAPVPWGYGPWAGGPCWNVVEINVIYAPRIWTHVRYEPPVIHRFQPPPGNRPLTPPWSRSPVVVTPGEFRDPSRFQQVTRNPDLSWQRLQDYGRQNRRTIYQRPLQAPWTPSSGGPAFEDRNHLKPPPVRPVPAGPPNGGPSNGGRPGGGPPNGGRPGGMPPSGGPPHGGFPEGGSPARPVNPGPNRPLSPSGPTPQPVNPTPQPRPQPQPQPKPKPPVQPQSQPQPQGPEVQQAPSQGTPPPPYYPPPPSKKRPLERP